MARFTAGSAVKYIVLPGVLPRIRTLFFNGFSLLAYYIAFIYGMAKILPAGHPYLNYANIGKFGSIQAVLAGWRHLEFKWKNIDRIVFFFALVSGLTLMLTYILGSFFFLMTAPSMAATPGFSELLANPNPTNDLAFMMLDRMLGIPGIYNSKVITSGEFGMMPTTFHYALQALFAYFSWGLFGIALIMLFYFLVDIVLETTMTGKPFGKHFENIWVPLRLVAGIGLLIPVSFGLNSAQWITLYVAKSGSNFATNAWIAFNNNMMNPMGMDNKELISLPVTPDFTGLAKDLFTIRACKDVDNKLTLGKIMSQKKPETEPSDPDTIVVSALSTKKSVDAYFVDGNRYFSILGAKNLVGKNWPDGYNSNFINLYLEGLRFYKGRDVRIVFGRFNEKWLAEGTYPGGVEPVCGEVLIPNMLQIDEPIPAGNITNAEVSDGILIGASHMFAVLKMTIGISKTGFGKEAGGDDTYEFTMLKFATDRQYYRETSQGDKKLKEYKNDVNSQIAENPDWATGWKNPDCPNDDNNDGIDSDGDELTFPQLGKCDGPVGHQFYMELVQRYQQYLSYGPIMGYDYYTGLGQEALDKRCSLIDCSKVVSGAAGTDGTCDRELKTCEKTRDGYADYRPLPSVYFEDLGQENPSSIKRNIPNGLFSYGWGGAGIWYKFIADKNGQLTGATNSLPRTTHYPEMMEKVSMETATQNKSAVSGCERFNPEVAEGLISVGNTADNAVELAKLYHNMCKNVQENEHVKLAGTNAAKSGNPLLDVINAVFATKALYDFRENQSVNPMSQLATLGRALIDKAVQNIMMGAGGAAVGGLASLFGSMTDTDMSPLLKGAGAATSGLSSVMVSFALTGLVAGILLFYVIPFLPFMYFFFAVGTWVKTIFEALVGVPLWALAHLRLDGGPGFAGKAATDGYYLLLEIFIRPILTVFSLVGSSLVFMALAYMLNVTWGVVTSNLVGFDPITQASKNIADITFYRPKVDQFFFTIVYIIFMYMLATGSFKLIDQIPDGIMRWLSSAKAWGVNDSADAMVQDISQTVAWPASAALQATVPAGVDIIGKLPGGIVGGMQDMANMTKSFGGPSVPGPAAAAPSAPAAGPPSGPTPPPAAK